MQVTESPSKPGTRSLRFQIRAPLRYRIRGERNWREGMTVNISDSGVLFHGDHMLNPGTLVEINFTLPVKLMGGSGARIICPGIIARVTEHPLLAAKFFGPRLHRSIETGKE